MQPISWLGFRVSWSSCGLQRYLAAQSIQSTEGWSITRWILSEFFTCRWAEHPAGRAQARRQGRTRHVFWQWKRSKRSKYRTKHEHAKQPCWRRQPLIQQRWIRRCRTRKEPGIDARPARADPTNVEFERQPRSKEQSSWFTTDGKKV